MVQPVEDENKKGPSVWLATFHGEDRATFQSCTVKGEGAVVANYRKGH